MSAPLFYYWYFTRKRRKKRISPGCAFVIMTVDKRSGYQIKAG
ncbi:hypothetical protein CLOSTHATH_01225 [Hungatella hathewayi DSM 13479]|uniref:Uncharacterized protein n=1 Tax=Hungatella hathewayi DSM 13479 TaxID=566550 RepID=D3AC97_9FIRM|nr:hypothetical protein CLOSTHATH_01225 [Hungatella hathewayi DSM 13479]